MVSGYPPSIVGIMINLDYELDVIYNHHGNKPVHMSSREFPDWANWGGSPLNVNRILP